MKHHKIYTNFLIRTASWQLDSQRTLSNSQLTASDPIDAVSQLFFSSSQPSWLLDTLYILSEKNRYLLYIRWIQYSISIYFKFAYRNFWPHCRRGHPDHTDLQVCLIRLRLVVLIRIVLSAFAGCTFERWSSGVPP